LIKLKNLFLYIKLSIKKQIHLYKSGSLIQERSTVIRTVLATFFYVLSILALIPSLIHVLFDAVVHGPAMIISFSLFQICQTI
jgi:hypothetical protein